MLPWSFQMICFYEVFQGVCGLLGGHDSVREMGSCTNERSEQKSSQAPQVPKEARNMGSAIGVGSLGSPWSEAGVAQGEGWARRNPTERERRGLGTQSSHGLPNPFHC